MARSRVYRVTIRTAKARTAKMSSMTSSKFPAASAVDNERPLFRGQEGQFPEPVPGDERRGQR